MDFLPDDGAGIRTPGMPLLELPARIDDIPRVKCAYVESAGPITFVTRP